MNSNVKIEVFDDGLSFSDIYDKEYFPKEYEKELKLANVLLLPRESFKEYNNPVFPEETQKFFEYIKEKSEKTKVISDICISDDNFRELELHADVINLPELIVTLVAFPVITNIISEYFIDKIKERNRDIDARVNISVEHKGDAKKIYFEGNVKDFEKAINTISKNLFDE